MSASYLASLVLAVLLLPFRSPLQCCCFTNCKFSINLLFVGSPLMFLALTVILDGILKGGLMEQELLA